MSEDFQKRLAAIRDQIDGIDDRILALINERAACAQEVASIKRATEGETHFYRPEREAQVLRRVLANSQGPLHNEEMARLFREIMSACLALEEPLTIAYLGPEGTFTQAAALKHFGHAVKTLALPAIDVVFREVEAGDAQYGVVPVENSTEGVINHTLDMFMTSPLKISGEVEIRIHQHLIGRPGVDLETVETVYSHQQSLAQCREWLDANLPRAERVPISSNAEAVRLARENPRAVAVAGETAAEIYGLELLARNIEDEPDNTTRFLIIGKQSVPPSGHDKTSLLVSTANKPGALYRLLEPLARNDVSMTRIESRPSRRGMWDYVFFVDIAGHAEEENVRRAFAELSADSSLFKVLGSYPIAVL
ncbi:MAG: prephenate dehydratase [Gammaproteobacteria bacterium]|nr:prephenate dehydratase [Gammaproteobacteria bacterium]